MKKCVNTKNTARTVEAARARKAARLAKAKRAGRATMASRTAQTTLAAAIGAGILLQGGQHAPGPDPSGVTVVHRVALSTSQDGDDSGSGSGSGSSNSGASTSSTSSDADDSASHGEDADRSNSDGSGSGTSSGSASSDSSGSGSSGAGSSSSDSDSASSGAGASGSAPSDTGASGSSSDGAAGGSGSTAGTGAATGTSTSGTTSGSPSAQPSGPSAPAAGPTTGAPTAAPAAPSPSTNPIPIPSVPQRGAGPVGARPAAPTRATQADAPGTAGRPAGPATTVAPRTTQAVGSGGAAGHSTPTARVTHAVAQNLFTRIALGLAGIVPTTSNGVPGPLAPAAPSSALLIAQWALVRRGGNPLFNQSPTAGPTQASSSTGLVLGDLHATDPDGDHLTYTVLDGPDHGDVVVHPDGTFTYTPDAEFARSGGSDTFTVRVRDNDPTAPGAGRYTDLLRGVVARNHPGLASRLFGAHAITVTVPVTVTPTATNTPPVVTPPPAPTVVRATGAVSGSLGVRDADGDPLVFTVPEQPGTGSVTLDQATGTYTFTPNAAARRAAAGTPGADTVTFTVLVSDGQGAAVPVEVTVAVDPGPAEVVAAIPVGTGTQTLVASPDGRRIYAIGSAGAPATPTFAARAFSSLASVQPTGTTISIIDAGSNTLVSTVMLPGDVDGLAFSPDGTHAFVTSYEGDRYSGPSTVTVIDVATDAVVATINAEDSYGDVYFSPDGGHAYLSDYAADTITVLDLGNNTTTTISVPSPQYLTFSPDGRRAYMPSVTDDTTVIIDTSDHSVIGSVPGYGAPVFGADGRYGYVVDYGGTVTVIDTRDDSVPAIIPVGSFPSNIQFGAGGAFAYVVNTYGEGEKLTIIDTSDHSSTTVDLGDNPRGLELSPDLTRGYIVDHDRGTVLVIDTAHGVVLDTVDTSDAEYSFIGQGVFSPDGTRYYVTDDRTLTIINTVDDSVTTLDVGFGRFDFTPDGSHASVLGYGDASGTTLQLISTADDSVRTFTVGTSYANSVVFSPDGSRAYIRSWDDELTVLDTTSGATTTVEVGHDVNGPQFSPDGRQLYLVGYDWSGDLDGEPAESGTVTVIDTVDDTVWTVPVGVWPSRVAFSPDGEQAYVTSDRGPEGTVVTVIDRATGTATTFDAGPYASDVEFSPDGRFGYVFSYSDTGEDSQVTFIDLADGARSVVPVPAATHGIRFSGDGRSAYVLNGRDGTATVISLDDAAEADSRLA